MQKEKIIRKKNLFISHYVRAYSPRPLHPPPFLCCIVQMLLFMWVVVEAISAHQLQWELLAMMMMTEKK